MRTLPTVTLLVSACTSLLACVDRSPAGPVYRPSSNAAARVGVGAADVTIDFSSFGEGKEFQPTFYKLDGILFPSEECGPAGCRPWFVGFTQGDAGLEGQPRFGPVTATFMRPISDLSLRVAPRLQGTATYLLSAFAASGELLATTSLTVTQDEGDPANSGPGYFTISLTDLHGPAKRFALDNVFVRSSFPLPLNTEIDYAVSSISYLHWR